MTSRYINDTPIKGGTILRTASGVANIRKAYKEGRLLVRERILKENERIDQIAGQELGNSTMWWVIAALSNIGWALQAPPGTILKIPEDVRSVMRLL